jgi:hypothetical protein
MGSENGCVEVIVMKVLVGSHFIYRNCLMHISYYFSLRLLTFHGLRRGVLLQISL